MKEKKEQKNNDSLLLCFKYVVDFYYGDVELKTINTILAHDKKHTEIDDVKYGAHDFGFHFEDTEFSADIIESHVLPCILVGRDNKAVILTDMQEGILNIFNPLDGRRTLLSIADGAQIYERILYLYKDIDYKGVLTHEEKGKEWFWQHLIEAKPDIVRIAIFTVFINIFIILIPLYTMNVYNRVIPNFATETLFVLTFGVMLIFLFDAIFKTVRVYLLEYMGRKIGSALEEELLKKLLSVQSIHDHLLTGAKANLFKEIAQVRDFFMSKTITHALDLPFVLLTFIVIFIISPAVSLVVLVCGAIIIGINLAFQAPIFSLSRKLFKDGQLKHNYLFETIKGTETLKLTNGVSKRIFKWRQLVNFYNFINLKMQVYSGLASNLSYIVMQMATVMALVVGVFQIQDKNLTIGALVALGILVGRAMAPIVGISAFLGKYKEFKEALESLNKFWHLPVETQRHIEFGVKKLSGDIEFNNVSFTYSGTKQPSIVGATFKIKAGEKVGFIGRTGAGKSTIMRLIAGLDAPSSGTVFIDGHEINTIHPVELRDNIGVMPQEPFLFAGKLKENIEIGKNIGKDALVKLLAMTGLEDLVKRSGEGENFQVGEGGSRLSVGQRHLVGLARALVNNPPILILDEPTTGMDVGLEREMVEHLKPIVADKTLIVITHRFAALDLVDRVFVVNNGRIVADGPKEIILAQLQGTAQSNG